MKTRQSFFAAQEQALTLNPASSRGYKLEDVLKHHFFFLLVPTGNCFFPRDSKLFFPTGLKTVFPHGTQNCFSPQELMPLQEVTSLEIA